MKSKRTLLTITSQQAATAPERRSRMKRGHGRVKSRAVSLVALFLAAGLTTPATAQKAIELSDEQIENIVRLSYPYVALYNVNNKFALDESGPTSLGGWNKILANTTLAERIK